MPFNPHVDSHGEGNWSDLEASDSEIEREPLLPVVRDVHANAPVASSLDEATAEEKVRDPTEADPNSRQTIILSLEDNQPLDQSDNDAGLENDLEPSKELDSGNLLNDFLRSPKIPKRSFQLSTDEDGRATITNHTIVRSAVKVEDEFEAPSSDSRTRMPLVTCPNLAERFRQTGGEEARCSNGLLVVLYCDRLGEASIGPSMSQYNPSAAVSGSSGADRLHNEFFQPDHPRNSKDLVFSDVLSEELDEYGTAQQPGAGSKAQKRKRHTDGTASALPPPYTEGATYVPRSGQVPAYRSSFEGIEEDELVAFTAESEAGLKESQSDSEFHSYIWDHALIQMRQQGLPYTEIKRRLKLNEATATLRGRFMILRKAGFVDQVARDEDPMVDAPTHPTPSSRTIMEEVVAAGGSRTWILPSPRNSRYHEPGAESGQAVHTSPKSQKSTAGPKLGTFVTVATSQAHPRHSNGVQMKLVDPEESQRVQCQQCIKWHQSCNGRLPCNTCRKRKSPQKCAFSDIFTPASPQPTVSAKPESPMRKANVKPTKQQPLSNESTMVRMVNVDPDDERFVVCEECRKCHSTCDTMLPCKRCTNRGLGHRCRYSERFVRFNAENTSGPPTDSGYITVSPDTSTLFPEGQSFASAEAKAQPARNIIADTESDNDDIVHQEDPADTETIEIRSSHRRSPLARDGSLSLWKTAEEFGASSAGMRRASNSNLSDLSQPRQKRARAGSTEAGWRPSRKARLDSESRPATRLPTTNPKKQSYLTRLTSTDESPFPHADQREKDDDLETVKPEEVGPTIREIFANMAKDIVVDIMPRWGRGRTQLARRGEPTKHPSEYSSKQVATSLRAKRAKMTGLEEILYLRERNDTNSFRQFMQSIRAAPFYRWDQLTEEEQEKLKEQKRVDHARQRDEHGQSANFFVSHLLELAVSCVGQSSMLQFLIHTREARLGLVRLFKGLVEFEDTGSLRLLAGNHDEG